jgi:hypothetical protein
MTREPGNLGCNLAIVLMSFLPVLSLVLGLFTSGLGCLLLIRATPWLDRQLLTRRPENAPSMMPRGEWPNVSLGASVETRDYVPRLDAPPDARRRVRCPVLLCSAEPLLGPLDLSGRGGVNWVIIGGESGRGTRAFRLSWCLSLIRQGEAAGVACFVKQAGDAPEADVPGLGRQRRVPLPMITSPKGGDVEEWPGWMQVREFPRVTPAAPVSDDLGL